MSEKTVINLNEVNVEEHQIREVLKCIIHTVIFNRALGHVSPRDMDLQLINVSYVEVADDNIERQVNEGLKAVEDFVSSQRPWSSSSQPEDSSGMPFVVNLAFYEPRLRQGLMRSYKEKVFWEVWKIRLRLVRASQSKADRESRQQLLKADVDGIRTVILHHADSKTDTPPVQSAGASPLTYPFEITPERQAGLAGSILGTVSRILSGTSQTPPDILGSK